MASRTPIPGGSVVTVAALTGPQRIALSLIRQHCDVDPSPGREITDALKTMQAMCNSAPDQARLEAE
jgi:hypothetical protein